MKKFAFIGGGSFEFTRPLVKDLLPFPAFRDAEFALMDIDEERLGYIKQECEKIVRVGKYPAKITATTDRVEALKGADGVIICGCHPGDCHYSTGNYYARRRMTLLFSMLDYMGIERGRTRVEWVSAAEGVKFSTTMNDFVDTIRKMGPNVRLGDLRCKN